MPPLPVLAVTLENKAVNILGLLQAPTEGMTLSQAMRVGKELQRAFIALHKAANIAAEERS